MDKPMINNLHDSVSDTSGAQEGPTASEGQVEHS